MNKSRAKGAFALSLTAICLLLICTHTSWAKGELSAKDARKLIARIGGSSLPADDVKVRSVQSADARTAIAQAQIETAFRFERDDAERWHVAEVRTSADRWEDLRLFARVLGVEGEAPTAFDEAGAPVARAASELNAASARRLLASFIRLELPSDDVRVREVSSLYNSAVVVAQVTAEFRFTRDGAGKWRLTGMRLGRGEWTDIEEVIRAVNQEKLKRAHQELEAVATALQAFRRERGFYVVADNTGALVDQLNPRYLGRVIRLDPWHKPYRYQGTRDTFTLRSTGADGLPDTADDISLTPDSRLDRSTR